MQETPEYLVHRLVMEMDRIADKILSNKFGMSYKRCQFLAVLQHSGTITQHRLAVILGLSDPAVSRMMVSLLKAELITIKIDPDHARKRLVTLTSKGDKITSEGVAILNAHFKGIISNAGIDPISYSKQTKDLLNALIHHGA
jgi:DNA-binding MarR family transcriptional regulator